MRVAWRTDALTIQGQETPDHRILELVTWRDLPLTLRVQTEDFGAHDGASPVGSIEEITAAAGDGKLAAWGWFSETEPGQLAATWVAEKVLRGVSVDPGAIEYVEELVDPATGESVGMEQVMEVWDQIDAAEILGDEAEAARLYDWLESLYYRVRFTLYEVAAATLVATPAFGECVIEVWDGPDAPTPDGSPADGTTSEPAGSPAPEPAAAAASTVRERLAALLGSEPTAPTTPATEPARRPVSERLAALLPAAQGRQVAASSPGRMIATAPDARFVPPSVAEGIRQAAAVAPLRADWFEPVATDRLLKFTITDDGRMMGHLFAWGDCHRGNTARCDRPDFMRDDPTFPDFHVGEAPLDNGERVRVGVLTYADLHAPDGQLTAAQLTELMEHTGRQLGPVRLHVDRFGLQACGQVWPDVPPVEVSRALAGFPSYDARRIAGRWRLFGLHVVNTPGHTVYEEAEGQVVRMVASVAPAVGPKAAAALAKLQGAPGASGGSCGCGGSSAQASASGAASEGQSGCTCGASSGRKGLSASALADLAALDTAMDHRRGRPARV